LRLESPQPTEAADRATPYVPHRCVLVQGHTELTLLVCVALR
jgi:hypothetical protein